MQKKKIETDSPISMTKKIVRTILSLNLCIFRLHKMDDLSFLKIKFKCYEKRFVAEIVRKIYKPSANGSARSGEMTKRRLL